MTSPGEVDSTSKLDELARELARRRDEEERRLDATEEASALLQQPAPLPLNLATLRRGNIGKNTDSSAQRGQRLEASMDESIHQPKRGEKEDTAAQVARRSGMPQLEPAAQVLTQMDASERKSSHESATYPQLVPQPVPLTNILRGRGEASAVAQLHVRPELAPPPVVSEPGTLQSGLTYRFYSWGADHAVMVQGYAGGNLLLQPSDALVTQRLSEQWQSGNPQQWQLAGGEGEGREQQQPSRDEEDEA